MKKNRFTVAFLLGDGFRTVELLLKNFPNVTSTVILEKSLFCSYRRIRVPAIMCTKPKDFC